MAANFSPEFVLDITENIAIGGTATISTFDQAFQIVGMRVSGDTGCTVTLTNAGAEAVVTIVNGIAIGLPGENPKVTNANCSVAANATIVATVTVAAATRIEILCRSANARAVTVVVA